MEQMKNTIRCFALASAVALCVSCSSDDEGPALRPDEPMPTLKIIGAPSAFPPLYTLADLRAADALILESGPIAYAAGYRQMSANNADPVLAKFVNDSLVWERADYDTTNDDGRGYGLLWDGGATLYAVFSTLGHQGLPSHDFRRFAVNGWLSHYGMGSGQKAAVIGKLDVGTGEITHATYLRSQLSTGESNYCEVLDMELLNNAYVRVHAQSGFSPLLPSGQPMVCTGESPFAYQLDLSPQLDLVERASAAGCD